MARKADIHFRNVVTPTKESTKGKSDFKDFHEQKNDLSI